MSESIPRGSGDIFNKCYQLNDVDEARASKRNLIFRPVDSAQIPEVTVGGRKMIMIGSNSYLGLTTHPRVKAAAKEAIDRFGTGSAGSRWLNGNMLLHEQLEAKLAQFLGQEAAVVFSTGYQTNLGAITCLVGKDDVVIIDKLDHASIVDGCMMSSGTMYRYRHNDMDDLERILKREADRAKMIVIDGVFSMEGDLADLPSIVDLAQRYGARVFLDDAHGVGVLGKEGRGTAEHFGLTEEVDLIMGTFSKTLACVGGFMAGAAQPIEYIKYASRPLMFSAALPPSLAATVLAALEVIETEPELRERMWRNAKIMKKGLDGLGFDTGQSTTPIIPVVLGGEAKVAAMVSALDERGVFANPVGTPAVPPGRELIRTSVMATHTSDHLQRALDAFAEAGRGMGLIP